MSSLENTCDERYGFARIVEIPKRKRACAANTSQKRRKINRKVKRRPSPTKKKTVAVAKTPQSPTSSATSSPRSFSKANFFQQIQGTRQQQVSQKLASRLPPGPKVQAPTAKKISPSRRFVLVYAKEWEQLKPGQAQKTSRKECVPCKGGVIRW
ncbi:hypothetical protein CEXT_568331 [Caerostris extrusa]|uniref:Uncharacterized protein n=1 Tax=Caerostris extrusa TaxID=172846 RepID=A0AAV4XWZ5_CAEEX|nr:hypothetical protein CEXT_568331 [Caerostris extrusa]